jgi:branched-chain amino acid transport system permease protein
VAKAAVETKFTGTPGQIRRQRIERIGAIAISFIAAFWMLINIIQSPDQFAQSAIAGLRNGLIYAMIALGYTLVYGIIELINFAHGDLFMLSAVFSSFFITFWMGADKSNG